MELLGRSAMNINLEVILLPFLRHSRRLFCNVTRACQGVLFDSLQTVMGLIQKTKTQQGLSVTVRVLDKLYEGGRTVSEAFKKNMPIIFDPVLPKWNYWAVPQ